MKKLVLVTMFLSMACISFCQKTGIPYERLSVPEGLTDNYVHCILQDHTGFIWIGGITGIFRYDGYNFVYYKILPGCLNCQPLGQVYDLKEDDKGLIWIHSKTGIYLLDPVSEISLQAYPFGRDSISVNVSTSYQELMVDSRGYTWATNGRGLIKFSLSERAGFKQLKSSETLAESLRIEFVHLDRDILSDRNVAYDIYEDDQHNIWVGALDGLHVLRKGDTAFCRLGIPYVAEKMHITYVCDIMQLNEDSFYVISWENYVISNVKKALNKPVADGSVIRLDRVRLPGENSAYCLFKDRRNYVYIGANLNTYRIHKASPQAVFHFEPLYMNPADPSDNKTYKYTRQILEDRTGILWTANYFYGLIRYDLNPLKFRTYREEISTYFSNTDVNHITQDYQGNLWIGVYGGGLYKIIKHSNRVLRYDLGPPYERNNIITLAEESPGHMLIGLNGGLLAFNMHTGRCTDPLPRGRASRNLKNSEVYDILKDDQCFYLATTNGLFVLDRTRDKLYQYAFTGDDSSSNYMNMVLSPIRLDNGEIWMTSAHFGINRISFNAQSGEIKLQSIVPDSILKRNDITLEGRNRIFQASNGTIWIINKNGLHHLHPDLIHADHYQLFENVEFPEAWSIQEDLHGNLWMGTQYGLCMFNINNKQLKTYAPGNSLPVVLHGYNTTHRDEDGRIYFGGVGGFYSFHPDSMYTNDSVPPVVITRFRLYNRAVPVSHAKHSILTNNIAYTDHIELSHKQHDISFEFAALDYSRPERNAYAYILEGFAKEWTKTSAANRIASFTNLRPGKYVFRVKGSNNDGIWNEEGASVTVVIHKPWWGTHFAWCMYTLAFISMVFSYISLRTRSLRKEKIVLEQQVSERTQKIELQRAELKSANTQLETKQKELQSVNLRLEEQKEELIQQKEELQSTLENLKKTQDQLIESEKMAALGRLVTGIAHEINIPVGIGITAISSLLEDVQKTTVQYEKEEISARNFKGFLESTMDTAKLIRKNLERTSSLIRSFRQVSSDQITEQKRSFLFRDYYNDILLSLRPKFRGKNIEFRVVCDDKLMLNSYPGVYAQIFTNLLINSLQHGFYAKNSGIITLNAEMDGDLLRIQYRDDGEGISKKDLPHIFEPFYSSGQCIGTGLGLNIVYNLIRQKLHGTIACESELGKGVLFQIEVPL